MAEQPKHAYKVEFGTAKIGSERAARVMANKLAKRQRKLAVRIELRAAKVCRKLLERLLDRDIRRREIEAGIDRAARERNRSLDAQLRDLVDNLDPSKTTYAQFVADVQKILRPR